MARIKYSLFGFCLLVTFFAVISLVGRSNLAGKTPPADFEIPTAPILSQGDDIRTAQANKDVVISTPMTPEALAAVTPHTTTLSVPTQRPLDRFLGFFSSKDTVPADVEGIIGVLDGNKQGLLAMNDRTTGAYSVVVVDANTKIMNGKVPATFDELGVADTIRVQGERNDALQLITATSITIIRAAAMPPVSPAF